MLIEVLGPNASTWAHARSIRSSDALHSFSSKRPSCRALLTASIAGATALALSPSAPLSTFPSETQAQQHCPGETVVWLNFPTAVYHYKGQRWYGTTVPGAFVCRSEADQAGDQTLGGPLGEMAHFSLDEFAIKPVSLHEVVRRTVLHDSPRLQNDDAIEIPQG